MNDEKTIYDNEKTQYQSQNAEATQYDAAYEKEMNSPEEENPSEENQSEKKNSKFSWRQVTVGAASGILLGATGAMLSGSTTQSAVQEEPGGGGGLSEVHEGFLHGRENPGLCLFLHGGEGLGNHRSLPHRKQRGIHPLLPCGHPGAGKSHAV